MKTKILIVAILPLLMYVKVYSQYNLTVNISGLNNNKGQILFQLLDENEKELKGIRGEIKGNKCTIAIDGLKSGKYAFRYFHDENNNSKMDKTMVGIPKEGFGFSNNAKGNFGPPAFEKQLFDIKANTKMACIITYF